MGSMSIWHWLIVLAIVVLVFGTGKISGLMGDFGKGIKAFKKGLHEEDEADSGKTIEGNAANTTQAREKDRAPTA
jgi:sec-independent protein translocase protein TatA